MTGSTLMRRLKSGGFAYGVLLFLSCVLSVLSALIYVYGDLDEAEINAMDPVAAVTSGQKFSSLSVDSAGNILLSACFMHTSLCNLGASSRVLRWSMIPFLGSFVVLVCLNIRKLVFVALSRQCFTELDVLGEDTIAMVVCPNIFSLSFDDLEIFYDAPRSYVYELLYIAGAQAIGISVFFYVRTRGYIGRPLTEERSRHSEKGTIL